MAPSDSNGPDDSPSAISRIWVGGFKSLAEQQSIEVRPLTLLAGANSSGKSSLMQAVLLLKQTVEAPYDPGALRLDGPNVKFSAIEQILSAGGGRAPAEEFVVGMEVDRKSSFGFNFGRGAGGRIEVRKTTCTWLDTEDDEQRSFELWPNMSADELFHALGADDGTRTYFLNPRMPRESFVAVVRNRCVLAPKIELYRGGELIADYQPDFNPLTFFGLLERVIHISGARAHRDRTFPLSGTGPAFPGVFEHYSPSLIELWARCSPETLRVLGDDLSALGLASRVEPRVLDDTRIELRVSRMCKTRPGETADLVPIADVGFGVSEVLPVVVGLLAAKPGQLVYIEQPEIHLHPRAQLALAGLLAKAANRGVRVVAETHSSLVLLGVQSLVAEQKLPPDRVKLHWFTRSEADGMTQVTSADLDEAGRFGDWPEDFDDVSLRAQAHYLDAAESHLFGPR